MKKEPVKRYILLSILFFSIGLNSQVLRTSDYLTPRAIPHRTLLFNLSEAGQSKPLEWGLDMAWLSQENILRGIAFMGNSNIDIIRSSFTPTDSLVNGDLKAAELTMLNNRLAMLSYFPLSTKIMLNCDHPTVHSWYLGRPDRWAQLINVTANVTERQVAKLRVWLHLTNLILDGDSIQDTMGNHSFCKYAMNCARIRSLMLFG